MRVIKFRAWDGVDYMTKPFTLLDIQNGNIQFASSDTIIMQFTGLYDKNGKEIYEGDIIKGGIYASYEVKWDGEQMGWNIGSNAQHAFEVIGNIYENAELLTPTPAL